MNARAALVVLARASCSEPTPAAPQPTPTPRVVRLESAVEPIETEATPPASDAPLAMRAFDAVAPRGRTTAIAVRYAIPAATAARYAPITRGMHLVAQRLAPEPRAWIAPLAREGTFDPDARDGETARGALAVDPRALLGLPGDEGEYTLTLWIEDYVETLEHVRLPASDELPAAPAEPSVPLSVSELARDVGASPVIRPGAGCLHFDVDVGPGDAPLLVALAAPERAGARALFVQRPHGYAPGIFIGVDGCAAFPPSDDAERLHVFVLALRGSAVTASLDPTLPPLVGRPVIVPPCSEDQECVLAHGGCAGTIVATHRDVAARVNEIALSNQRVRECVRVSSIPVRAVCRARSCTTEPLDHPEWRGCRRDSDCRSVFRDCQRWEPIASSSADAARAAWATVVCPSIVPTPPDVSCVQGSCAIGWSGDSR